MTLAIINKQLYKWLTEENVNNQGAINQVREPESSNDT